MDVLVELEMEVPEALTAFSAFGEEPERAHGVVKDALPDIAGLELNEEMAPVPMFSESGHLEGEILDGISAFSARDLSADLPSVTQVVSARADEGAIEELRNQPGVRVWPDSEIVFHEVDCDPYAPGVDVATIQQALGVAEPWGAGAKGAGIVVGILDQGIHGATYPVAGGYSQPFGQSPGMAPITTHGSMCAADVLVAAPEAKLYDYPFMARQRSGGAIDMFNAALEQRRLDGTPQVLSNSWGYRTVPSQSQFPQHEVWNIGHPLHRKIREVVTSGATVLFSAGNCGQPCPTGNCDPSSIGPGRSIHASGALAEVITIAAVNASGVRIGYSSQGPGMFEHSKPDFACYSHFFGNFGPGRPAAALSDTPFDSGTSAACPVAAGVVATLLSAQPSLSPDAVRQALLHGAGAEWNPDTGYGIVNAAASFRSIAGAPA